MTDQSSPITPPPELIKHWEDQHFDEGENYDVMLIQAFHAGADQELKAVAKWLAFNGFNHAASKLIAARRPKPAPLKEEALKRLEFLEKLAEACGHDPDNTIRLALEQLND